MDKSARHWKFWIEYTKKTKELLKTSDQELVATFGENVLSTSNKENEQPEDETDISSMESSQFHSAEE